ncbi:MAG: hypothetical protein ACREGJ_02280 [Candidatus Saccharimonadales bacterium]
MDSILIAILAIVLIAAVILLAGITRLSRQKTGLDRAYYQAEWRAIEKFKSDGGAAWQLAVLEADKLLDHALKAKGITGETMGERLKSARQIFRNNDAIWYAHKLRNRLAHENSVKLNRVVVEKALRGFKTGLKDVGAL